MSWAETGKVKLKLSGNGNECKPLPMTTAAVFFTTRSYVTSNHGPVQNAQNIRRASLNRPTSVYPLGETSIQSCGQSSPRGEAGAKLNAHT